MKFIQVRAAQNDKNPRAIFDQEETGALVKGKRSRAIVKTDGRAVVVDASLKVVREAIDRGELVALEPFEADENKSAKADDAKPAPAEPVKK
jgi:hypothetical protein